MNQVEQGGGVGRRGSIWDVDGNCAVAREKRSKTEWQRRKREIEK